MGKEQGRLTDLLFKLGSPGLIRLSWCIIYLEKGSTLESGVSQYCTVQYRYRTVQYCTVLYTFSSKKYLQSYTSLSSLLPSLKSNLSLTLSLTHSLNLYLVSFFFPQASFLLVSSSSLPSKTKSIYHLRVHVSLSKNARSILSFLQAAADDGGRGRHVHLRRCARRACALPARLRGNCREGIAQSAALLAVRSKVLAAGAFATI